MTAGYRYEHTRADAEQIARDVETFHHKQGAFQVRAWAELTEKTFTDESGYLRVTRLYETKSNLVNGLPPRV